MDISFATLTISVDDVAPFYAGTSPTVFCTATGMWTSYKILKDGQDTGSSKDHEIREISSETAGEYSCTGAASNTCGDTDFIALNEAGDDDKIEVPVTMPTFLIDPTDISASTGANEIFTCKVPNPKGVGLTVKWSKSNENEAYWGSMDFDTTAATATSLLYRNSISFDSVGSYKCVATYGTRTAIVIESEEAALRLVGKYLLLPFSLLS